MKCGKCGHGKECGIYPEGHENRMKADGGKYKPREHGCPHCKTTCSFYTKKELKARKSYMKEFGKTKQIPFEYSKFDGLRQLACHCAACTH